MEVLKGDTVHLQAEFRTVNGMLVDPDELTLTVMDASGKQIGETIPDLSKYRSGLGIYTYEYVVPHTPSTLVYEFKGYVNGKPIIGRSVLHAVLVKNG